MVPRIHKRGSSFKGACGYILHDQGKKTRDRVDWVMTQHLGDTASEDAWKRMHETWRDRTAMKILAGLKTTGRDNTNPVLHFTLAWHKDDNPTPDHMQKMALESLKVLGLAEHQAVIAAHTDKEHQHVHVIVNTVHPFTGKTAPLKYTKERFSKWAEAYEREHGVHCEERIKNNAERERHARARKLDPTDLLMGRKGEASKMLMAAPQKRQARRPYVPVKDKSVGRKQWLDKKEITDRMRAMRATLDAQLKSDRDASWTRHQKARDVLDTRTDAAVEQARESVREQFRPQWRRLYAAQKKEAKHVDGLLGDLFGRAAYVFQNRERLGQAGKPLTLRQMLPMIRSGKQLSARVAHLHEKERRTLARSSKSQTKEMTEVIWTRHKAEMTALRDRQAAERQSERDVQVDRRKSVSFEMAKASIVAERVAAPRSFNRAPEPRPAYEAPPPPERFREAQAPPKRAAPIEVQQDFQKAVDPVPPAALSRTEQIKHDMAAWRRRNEGMDFGREM